MAGVRQVGTTPELAVRSILRDLGIGYRIGGRGLPGRPDLANRRRKWAIFVHGCYWHHHRNCRKATTPKSNVEFWKGKFVANRARDARAVKALRNRGFRVIIVWECQVRHRDSLVPRLAKLLSNRP